MSVALTLWRRSLNEVLRVRGALLPATIAPVVFMLGITGQFGRLTGLEGWLDRHAEEGFGTIRDAWRERSVTLGREVVVRTEGREIAGVAEDIDAQGALLVRGRAGVERILAGDVTLLRPR